MPAALATKDEIVDKLFTIFRDQGFEGASLADLSRATGLGKSSLYHYFPEGKQQMAEAVLHRAQQVVDRAVLGVAEGPEPLKAKTRLIAAALREMYAGGRTSCVLGQLAASEMGAPARENLRLAFDHWIEAVTRLGREAGMTPVRARNFAEDWIARLQGALILHAATGSTAAFERAIRALVELSATGSSDARMM